MPDCTFPKVHDCIKNKGMWTMYDVSGVLGIFGNRTRYKNQIYLMEF